MELISRHWNQKYYYSSILLMQWYWYWWKKCKKHNFIAVLLPSCTKTPKTRCSFHINIGFGIYGALQYQVFTSSPKLLAALQWFFHIYVSLLLHTLLNKWKVSGMEHWLAFKKMFTAREDIRFHVITVITVKSWKSITIFEASWKPQLHHRCHVFQHLWPGTIIIILPSSCSPGKENR